MARSQSELFMQQLLGSCSDRSLSLSSARLGQSLGQLFGPLCAIHSASVAKLADPRCCHRRLLTGAVENDRHWGLSCQSAFRIGTVESRRHGCQNRSVMTPAAARRLPRLPIMRRSVRNSKTVRLGSVVQWPFPWKRPTILFRSPQDHRSGFAGHVPHRKMTAVRKPV